MGILYLIVGFLLFYLGKIFHLKFLIKFGFKLVAMGFAPFFGLGKYWLSKNCPLNNCDYCRLWTCSKY